MAIYTIGHSTRSLAELAAILHEHTVKRVVDVRTIPRSATNPQYNADTLARSLSRFELRYTLMLPLGGRRPKSKVIADDVNAGWRVRSFHNYADYALTPPFREALDELIAMSKREACAIMCAEAVWWRCHRRIITDHLLARGVPVMHLLGEGKSEPATITPFAHVDEDERVTYPATADEADDR